MYYQGYFSDYDSITGQYDFLLRNYDPALGRWWQTDPYNQFASPYLGMGNGPHFSIDPDGGLTDPEFTFFMEALTVTGSSLPFGFGLSAALNALRTVGGAYLQATALQKAASLVGSGGYEVEYGLTYYQGSMGISYSNYPPNSHYTPYDPMNPIGLGVMETPEVSIPDKLAPRAENWIPGYKMIQRFGWNPYNWPRGTGPVVTGSPKFIEFFGAAPLAIFGRATKGVPKYLYHYTNKAAAQNISKVGMQTKYSSDGFLYLTNTGKLSPLQAQIQLALPANKALPSSLLRINTKGLSPSIIRRVQGNLPGMGAGGGTEFLFNQNIPASAIKIIR